MFTDTVDFHELNVIEFNPLTAPHPPAPSPPTTTTTITTGAIAATSIGGGFHKYVIPTHPTPSDLDPRSMNPGP